MGIDVHALNFLRYVKQFGGFGRTVTIGRQNIDFRPDHFLRFTGKLSAATEDRYCEPLLIEHFGATTVDSVDNSDFENATIIHDLNRPLAPEMRSGRFDTLIDGGCLEHIFQAPIALRTFSELTAPGGQIVHVIPANNFCGHGFYQFSPELFFSLYSEINGYRDTEVFLADATRLDRWFRVNAPSNGLRANAHSATPLYLLVRTVKISSDFRHDTVQQSDYVHRWNEAETLSPEPKRAKKRKSAVVIALRNIAMSSSIGSAIASAIRPKTWSRRTEQLDSKNPHLQEFQISSIRD